MAWRSLGICLATLTLTACTPAPSPSPTTSPATCAAMPPVYHPQRLKQLEPCVLFRGVVLADLHEQDGDRHLWLAPDAGYEGFLSAANLYRGRKALVAEIVPACASEPADEAAAAQCPASRLGAPVAGSHVEITGRWVEDLNHSSWREIHPVSTLKILSRSTP